MAAGRAPKSTALDQATQLHLSVLMFGRLNPVILLLLTSWLPFNPSPVGRLSPVVEFEGPMLGLVTAR